MTNTKGLSHKQICDIIRLCNKNHVSKIKFNDFEIEFQNSQPDGNQSVYATRDEKADGRNPFVNSVATEVEGSLKPKVVQLTPEQKELLNEVRLSALMTSDPVAYEQEMIDAAENDSASQPEGDDAFSGQEN
jgi:hypothetical protein